MTRVARLSLVGFVIAGAVFVAAYAIIPMRVTLGAGSLRCGTALDPDREGEVSAVCPDIGHQRLNDAVIATAVFALVAAAPLPLHRWIDKRSALRLLVTLAMVAFWVLGGMVTLYWMTGAYSPST